MVAKLQFLGLKVTIFDDTPEPHTPDSIFPNNWVSFHQNGQVVLYPMQAQNRRLERRSDIIDALKNELNIETIVDLTYLENQNSYLEGTGSMVLDRTNSIAYACLSPRTTLTALDTFAQVANYQVITFSANDANGQAIYHTNVMMCIGDAFAVLCLEAITDAEERQKVIQALQKSQKTIIEISMDQMNRFAGNMLLTHNDKAEKLLLMSSQAYHSLTEIQRNDLANFAQLQHFDLLTIETLGGGSARCMMAELYG
jgi:hypothetical protein